MRLDPTGLMFEELTQFSVDCISMAEFHNGMLSTFFSDTSIFQEYFNATELRSSASHRIVNFKKQLHCFN